MGSVIVDKIKKTKSNIKQLIVPNQMFEGMGITYLGPVDGHDIEKLIKIFRWLSGLTMPCWYMW